MRRIVYHNPSGEYMSISNCVPWLLLTELSASEQDILAEELGTCLLHCYGSDIGEL